MLLKRSQSLLLLIDIQEKLAPALHESKQIQDTAFNLLQVAQKLDVTTWATEQYPQGLGHTMASLKTWLKTECVFHKTHFSALKETHILQAFEHSNHTQTVVVGAEAHVCVLQTVLDLLALGQEVFVVEDGVTSRTPLNKQLALMRMRQAGAQIVSQEMVLFEWLECANTDTFRHIHQNFIR